MAASQHPQRSPVTSGLPQPVESRMKRPHRHPAENTEDVLHSGLIYPPDVQMQSHDYVVVRAQRSHNRSTKYRGRPRYDLTSADLAREEEWAAAFLSRCSAFMREQNDQSSAEPDESCHEWASGTSKCADPSLEQGVRMTADGSVVPPGPVDPCPAGSLLEAETGALSACKYYPNRSFLSEEEDSEASTEDLRHPPTTSLTHVDYQALPDSPNFAWSRYSLHFGQDVCEAYERKAKRDACWRQEREERYGSDIARAFEGLPSPDGLRAKYNSIFEQDGESDPMLFYKRRRAHLESPEFSPTRRPARRSLGGKHKEHPSSTHDDEYAPELWHKEAAEEFEKNCNQWVHRELRWKREIADTVEMIRLGMYGEKAAQALSDPPTPDIASLLHMSKWAEDGIATDTHNSPDQSEEAQPLDYAAMSKDDPLYRDLCRRQYEALYGGGTDKRRERSPPTPRAARTLSTKVTGVLVYQGLPDRPSSASGWIRHASTPDPRFGRIICNAYETNMKCREFAEALRVERFGAETAEALRGQETPEEVLRVYLLKREAERAKIFPDDAGSSNSLDE